MEIKYLIEFAFLKVATSDGAVVAARVEFGRIAGGKLETWDGPRVWFKEVHTIITIVGILLKCSF